MARMHARRKGKSSSKRPLKTENPEWVPLPPKDIEELVVKLYKEGKSSAEIGLKLRDQYAVPSAKLATDRSLMDIIRKNNLLPEIPEDLANLMKKAVNLHEHLGENRRDLHNRRGLALVEAKIRRLARYYIRKGVLPQDWKYSVKTAKLLVE